MAKEKDFNINTNVTPPSIKRDLDQYVIGQDQVKKTLAMLSYYYIQSLRQTHNSDKDMSKSNALIIGDTGCGKTALMKTLSKILNVPFVTADASSLSGAGLVGNSVDEIFRPLLAVKDEYPDNKIPAIIFVDEIDKLIKKDALGRGDNLQHEFLKVMEGGEVHLATSQALGVEHQTLDTSKMMFVFAGSFPGLKRIVQHRAVMKEEKKIDPNAALKEIKSEDLMEFGLSREFLGRIEAVRPMEPVSKEMLMEIMIKPKNSIFKQYQEKIKALGVTLTVTEDAVEYIAEKALKNGTGARGLAGIIQGIMEDAMFELPEQKNVKEITINKDAVQNNAPIIERHDGRQSSVIPKESSASRKDSSFVTMNSEPGGLKSKLNYKTSGSPQHEDPGIYWGGTNGLDEKLPKPRDELGHALMLAEVLQDSIMILADKHKNLNKGKLKKLAQKFGRKTGTETSPKGKDELEDLIIHNGAVVLLEAELYEQIVALRVDKGLKIDYVRPKKLNHPLPASATILQKSMEGFDLPKLKKAVEQTIVSIEKLQGRENIRKESYSTGIKTYFTRHSTMGRCMD